jgi:hypothetical protein
MTQAQGLGTERTEPRKVHPGGSPRSPRRDVLRACLSQSGASLPQPSRGVCAACALGTPRLTIRRMLPSLRGVLLVRCKVLLVQRDVLFLQHDIRFFQRNVLLQQPVQHVEKGLPVLGR